MKNISRFLGGRFITGLIVIVPAIDQLPQKKWMFRVMMDVTLFIVALLFLFGCASIGPETVVRDRFNYTAALADSWKDQMLLNLVKLRYGDTPIFLDVASVINSYELSGSANLGGNWQFNPNFESDASLGTSGFYANRPTITYSPLSGEKFARSLMTPVPISAVLNLIQSGYPADLVFRLLVQSINGIKNRYGGSSISTAGDSLFYELAEKMKRIQVSGALGFKIQMVNGKDLLVVAFGRDKKERTDADIADVKKILGLDSRTDEFRVVYGMLQANDREIAVLSRSVLQILGHLASYIEVPEAHVADSRAYPAYRDAPFKNTSVAPLIRILSSPEKPEDAFFAVPYHNYWFWIDDKDLSSKQIFSFLMFIFTLVETGGKEGAPVVTVPVR